MYNLAQDPGETNDLAATSPKVLQEMIDHYSDYTEQFGVLAMGDDYVPLLEIQNKLVGQIREATMPWVFRFLALLLGFFVYKWWRKKNRRLVTTQK